MASEVFETRKKLLGPEHIDTISSMTTLAFRYVEREQVEEAEQLFLRALTKKRECLGPADPLTLAALTALSDFYAKQKRWDEAVDLQTQALDGFEKTYGEQNAWTIQARGVIIRLRNSQTTNSSGLSAA
jgi:tetratricopeptide (TPR) repeat protein